MMEANIGRMTAIKKKTAMVKKEIAQIRDQLSQMDQNDIESAIFKTNEFLAQLTSGTPTGKGESKSDVWQNIMTPSPQLI